MKDLVPLNLHSPFEKSLDMGSWNFVELILIFIRVRVYIQGG
jgi:hypothetical protein